jgi:hypothetical protein
MCQKAAEGSGAPAGLDSDAAHATVWLLGRGLPALGGLLNTLEGQGQHAADTCRFDNWLPVQPQTLDAAGKAGALIASGLIDLLVAGVASSVSRLTLLNLTMPLYLLPRAAQYTRDGMCFCFSVSDDTRTVRFILDVLPQREVILRGMDKAAEIDELLSASRSFTVEAACTPSPESLPNDQTTDLPVMLAGEALNMVQTQVLANGIAMPADDWDRLQVLATRVLVPGSEESRRRGAGAPGGDQD